MDIDLTINPSDVETPKLKRLIVDLLIMKEHIGNRKDNETGSLPMNFTVCKTDNINNAYAELDSDGIRSIVYDDKFLKGFDSDTLRLETITALAHEIGHHLSGHTLALSYQLIIQTG